MPYLMNAAPGHLAQGLPSVPSFHDVTQNAQSATLLGARPQVAAAFESNPLELASPQHADRTPDGRQSDSSGSLNRTSSSVASSSSSILLAMNSDKALADLRQSVDVAALSASPQRPLVRRDHASDPFSLLQSMDSEDARVHFEAQRLAMAEHLDKVRHGHGVDPDDSDISTHCSDFTIDSDAVRKARARKHKSKEKACPEKESENKNNDATGTGPVAGTTHDQQHQ